MRGFLPAYEARTPADLAEALALLAKEPSRWRPLAGATDLMVLLETGSLRDHRLLNILALPELQGLELEKNRFRIGALSTFTQIQRNAEVQKYFPLLCQAANQVGAVGIQNRATIGGNIANASPAADSPPALLVYDAEVELVSASGTRTIAYRDFHQGYKKIALRPDELIRAIWLPLPAHTGTVRQYYRKVGTRKAQAISKICLAGLAEIDGSGTIRSVRIAIGSVAPTVVRCVQTEASVLGKRPSDARSAARTALATEIAPIDDIRSTRDYRAEVAGNLLEEFLTQC